MESESEAETQQQQPDPSSEGLDPTTTTFPMPLDKETCERHISLIAHLLFSKAFQDLEKEAMKAEMLDVARKEAQRDRVLLVKALQEKFEQEIRENNEALLKQYEQIKAFVMKELQEIKPLALKQAVASYEKSLQASGRLHQVNPVYSEPEQSDNEDDAQAEQLNDIREPTLALDDDIMQISPSPSAKPVPTRPAPRSHKKAATAYGNLDDDLERELFTVLQRKALRRKIADEEEELRAEERREMTRRWDEEMRAQVTLVREELTEQFKAQLQEEQDKIRLLVSAEAEVEREQREAALEERIRREYETKIGAIMQSIGLE